jgi:nitrate reductase NapD
MPISGVVIRCRPERSAALARELAWPGCVEIRGELPDGTLVAVIEAPTVDDEVRLFKELLAVDGVEDVRLAYHNFEDLQGSSPDN